MYLLLDVQHIEVGWEASKHLRGNVLQQRRLALAVGCDDAIAVAFFDREPRVD